ncbi:response regulator [uncultured Roseobacter sp.]|uniref:response regulator n=1 Tax=uncultured Roseobacter sp. TaxID=114847 RepID=UPI00261CA37A|nr:response regulator [uncultured Roseobacter sp.]
MILRNKTVSQMEQNSTKEATFLLVDDDDISIMAMKRALKKLKIVNRVRVAKDGQDALEILNDAAEAAEGRLPPFIVTLDLNMPRMNGLEFLEAVRADPRLHRLVVFVFTTSDMPDDIQSAYSRNVAGYLVKDNPRETFARALDMLESYSRIVELPA